MQNDLSIIIVTYNPGAILLDCLRSLPAGLSKLSAEIIIVDNGSVDEVVPQAVRQFPHVRLIENQDNRGFAAANNQGMAAASGRCFLLLNPDVIVHQSAISTMAANLESNDAVGIAGPRTLDTQGRLSLTAYGAYTPFSILWQYFGLDRLFPYHVFGEYRRSSQTSDGPFEVAWVQGSCIMIRREVWEQIGGLDEGFFLFTEEPDFCARAKMAGWRTVHIPGAEIEHRESNTISSYPLVKMRHYHRSPLHYFRKRGQHLNVLILKIGFTLELIVKLLLRFFQFGWLADPRARARLLAYPVVLGEVWMY
jgi:GT2 family glycosyltransferase